MLYGVVVIHPNITLCVTWIHGAQLLWGLLLPKPLQSDENPTRYMYIAVIVGSEPLNGINESDLCLQAVDWMLKHFSASQSRAIGSFETIYLSGRVD